MTCCVAAIANGGNAIILVSDKMIGTANKRGEPHGITKGEAIHNDWWALFAGDVSLAGDLFSRLKAHFPDGPLSIYDARDALSTTLFEKWQSDAERAYLRKEGYTSETFRDEAPKKMAEEIYNEIRERRLRHSLKAELIVAGFDEQGDGAYSELQRLRRSRPVRSCKSRLGRVLRYRLGRGRRYVDDELQGR